MAKKSFDQRLQERWRRKVEKDRSETEARIREFIEDCKPPRRATVYLYIRS